MTAAGSTPHARGLRLEVPITFSSAPLEDVDVAAAVVAEPVRRLRTTHWDTADLRLARWSVALEHSGETGWVLRLPATAEGMTAPDGAELHFDGPADRPPEEALHLVRAYARHAPIELVARLVTLTGETVLLDDAGGQMARLVDETVSVYSGPRITQRFREIDLFSESESLLRADRRSVRSGRSPAGGTPRARRPRARARGVTAPGAGVRSRSVPSATAGDVVRRAFSTSVIRLLRHDPGVRLGIDAEDVHQARVATRRLRSDLRTFQPLLDREWTELVARGVALARRRAREGARCGGPSRPPSRRRRHASRASTGARRAAVVAPLVAQVRSARRHLLAAIETDHYYEVIDHLVAAARAPALTAGRG